jgi:hypothetical protein
MLPIPGILAFARSPVAIWIGAGLAVAGIAWYGYSTVFDRGVSACERDAVLSAAHAQEEAHQTYLAEVARGNELSAELVKTQRRLDATKAEYLAYAHGIAGNCPDPVRVLAHYSARGEPVPETTSPPTDAAPPVSAAALGANIAENYSRCLANAAQLKALIDWHAGSKEAVKAD